MISQYRVTVGPLGTVDPDKVRSAGYMIAPVDVAAEQYVADQLVRIRIETLGRRERVLFAAMSQETWELDPLDDLGRRLLAKGRLFEHPDVVEVSLVYGVAADGRRLYQYFCGPAGCRPRALPG